MMRHNSAVSTENQSPVGDKPPKKICNIKKQLSRPKVHWKKAASDGAHSHIDKDSILSRTSYELFYRSELAGCTQSGNEIVALCPFHDDKNPSFNANTQRWMFNCHACGEGGDIFHFVEKKHHKSFPEALAYLADCAGVTPTKPATLARKELPECPATLENLKAEYPYRDETGEPLYSVYRFEADGYRKSIRQGHPRNGKGERIRFGLPDGVARVPYNLDRFDLYDTIFVTEGENKANVLRRWCLLGTCNPGGAGKWQDEYSQYLKGKHVVILPDNDEPGRKHAQKVAESVLPVAASVKIVELPGLPAKGDLIDWKEAGHNREEFLALVEVTPLLSEVPAKEEKPLLRLYTMDDILNMPMPKWRIERLLPETGLAVIYGTSGSGKSFVCIDMAAALARGDEEWFGFRIVAPCNTLYVGPGRSVRIAITDEGPHQRQSATPKRNHIHHPKYRPARC